MQTVDWFSKFENIRVGLALLSVKFVDDTCFVTAGEASAGVDNLDRGSRPSATSSRLIDRVCCSFSKFLRRGTL